MSMKSGDAYDLICEQTRSNNKEVYYVAKDEEAASILRKAFHQLFEQNASYYIKKIKIESNG